MANETYISVGTEIVFKDTAGDYAISCDALTADAVRVSAQGDLGATPRPSLYRWRAIIDGFTTAPVVGETVNIYLAPGRSTTDIDGDVGSADAAGATVDLPNLMHIGTAVVQTTTAADELYVSGQVELWDRYVSFVIHNNTADALATADHEFALTPISYQTQ